MAGPEQTLENNSGESNGFTQIKQLAAQERLLQDTVPRDSEPVTGLWGTVCKIQPAAGELPVLNSGVYSMGCQFQNFAPDSPESKLRSAQHESVAHIYEKAGEWTSRFATGTGFTVGTKDDRCLIISDGHVADDTDDLQVKMADGHFYESEVVARNPARDLLLLSVEQSDPKLCKPVEMSSEAPRQGDPLIAMGFPAHSESLYISQGIMTGEIKRDDYRDGDGDALPTLPGEESSRRVYGSNMHVEGGNSGSPVFNVRGQVVSIVDAGDSNKLNSSFSTPLNAKIVEDLIKKVP